MSSGHELIWFEKRAMRIVVDGLRLEKMWNEKRVERSQSSDGGGESAERGGVYRKRKSKGI